MPPRIKRAGPAMPAAGMRPAPAAGKMLPTGQSSEMSAVNLA